MLYVRLGDFTEDCITNVKKFFDFYKQKDWFANPFVREVIRGVDKSEIIEGEYIESPVFGGMSPDRLSSGAKALSLMKMCPEYVIYATRCGDNCIPYLIELAMDRDVTVLLHHCPAFPKEFPEGFSVSFVESGVTVTNGEDFTEEFFRCWHEVLVR